MTRVLSAQGELKDALADFMPFIPRVRLTTAAGVVIAAGSGPTIIGWDTEEYDTDGMHDPAINSGRITIKTAGTYLVMGDVSMNGGMLANDDLRIVKNGVTNLDIAIYLAGQQSMKSFAVVELAVGDYLELRQSNGSGAARTVANAGYSWFEAVYIGPGFNAVRIKPTVQYVTPTQFAALAPVDGDEVYLVVDATKGIAWHMRYNAGSASVYKWEYLGGAPMQAYTGTGYAMTTSEATVPGVSLIVPRSGEYIATARAYDQHPGTVSQGHYSYFGICDPTTHPNLGGGGSDSRENQTYIGTWIPASQAMGYTFVVESLPYALVASQSLVCHAYGGIGEGGTLFGVNLTLRPIRIS